MAFDNTCFYCTKSEPLDTLMIEVCKLQVSTLYLMKDQTHKGRCVVALNDHKKELFELGEDERCMYMEDISNVAKALSELFSPDKINYAGYGDGVTHMHFHVVPKYKGGPEWGNPFSVSLEDKKILSKEEYDERIKLISNKLK
ncbi:histidine triad (HIT) protein [Clostridium novyi A str. 4552]|uniref:Histidine triad (HIT) protein n=1 Tax=Clostridium novyi A str. 4552 TaxID=1444289 RepID=A0A0A0I9E4_CLONO|nr:MULTISPECIES: HIT family protein [Clostridium]EDS78684.1 HIT family protein [Clostridium botulinum C str. Eklund]KEH98796.1 histidine triad (HIT) protein [Clostridium botulinum C/D str. BKT12695]KGM97522.1 histidine triad (HIT) protein [Clostridium novyi A str. 4552]NEZ48114.1 HIT family protein [Clostridium botulinum]